MSFSENLINIFNEVGKQMGVVINWTDDNVIPYITDLCDRIVNFEMMLSIMFLILCIVGLLMGIINLLIGFKKRRKYKTDSSYYSDSYITHFIMGTISTVVGSIMIPINIIDIMKCLTIKEMVIIEFISRYIN